VAFDITFDHLDGKASVFIYDLTGKLIWKQILSRRNDKLSLQPIAAGVYQIQIRLKDKKVNSKIIIK